MAFLRPSSEYSFYFNSYSNFYYNSIEQNFLCIISTIFYVITTYSSYIMVKIILLK